MMEIMTREAIACDLKDLVAKFIPEAIGKDIEKACQGKQWQEGKVKGGRAGGHQGKALAVTAQHARVAS